MQKGSKDIIKRVNKMSNALRLWRVRKLSDFIKNILICDEGPMGLDQHEGDNFLF